MNEYRVKKKKVKKNIVETHRKKTGNQAVSYVVSLKHVLKWHQRFSVTDGSWRQPSDELRYGAQIRMSTSLNGILKVGQTILGKAFQKNFLLGCFLFILILKQSVMFRSDKNCIDPLKRFPLGNLDSSRRSIIKYIHIVCLYP